MLTNRLLKSSWIGGAEAIDIARPIPVYGRADVRDTGFRLGWSSDFDVVSMWRFMVIDGKKDTQVSVQ